MSAILTRKQHRRAFRRGVLVNCQVVREKDFRRVAYLGVDLSTEGMLVLTHDRVLTGEELIVSFRAPLSYRWFDAEATVARVIHGRRPGDRGRGLGLEFHGLEEAWRHELFAYLRGLPPPASTRSSRLGAVS
jgi:c-di-GMP-binding flagellar brake protein YcgR